MLGFGLGLNKWRRVGGGFVGLLDLFPNAAAAYSLRKLRAAYSGAAVRVRESGGNTEADIGFDANGELDTVALLAHCGANDGFVTTWYDQSLSNNATQTTANNQPKIVSAGSLVTENGKPILDSNLSIMSIPINFQNKRYKIFSVSKNNSTFVTFGESDENLYQLIGQSGSISTQISSLVTNNSMRVNSITFTPTNRGDVYSALSIHNVMYNDTLFQAVSSTDPLLGYTGAIFGMMRSSEYIIYNDTFSDLDIPNVETNMKNYWGI